MSGARPLLVYADGPDGPLPDPGLVAGLAGLDDPEVLLGWVVRPPGWLTTSTAPVATVLAGIGTRAAVRTGRIRSTPARLSAVPALLGSLRPAVAVVGAVADGRGWRTTACPGWAPAAAEAAGAVVIERWPAGAAPPGPTPPITGRVVAVIDRTDPPDPPQAVTPGPVERAVGALVAGLVPEGATLQWGPGALGAAVVDALEVPVSVHSGVVTDELVTLAGRGLLVGRAVAAYAWGGSGLAELHGRNRLALRPVSEVHDPAILAGLDRLVAVNTALEVGLDGAANVEVVEAGVVSGPGGHPDFCLGASRSAGGMSIVALRAGNAERSGIVAAPRAVSTPRTDVDVVVTEYGVADLRGRSDRERGEALVAVAHPAHRERLAAHLGPGAT